MAGKWPYKRVEEIALKIAMGPFGSSIKVETFTDSGIPIISGQHLREAQVTDGEFNFIKEAHADSLKNANVQRGDVIFTHAGNIGQVAFIPDDSAYQRYVISQRQFYLRCNTDLMLPEFITYYFKTPEGQHRLLANANQVGVPSIARPSSYLKTIEVPAPSIEEQQVVVRNIKALDAKIRLNIGINQTIEAMAQAIFKSWFVDFDPVKAKIAAKERWLTQHPSPFGRGAGGEGKLPPPLLTFARDNRRNATDAESLMWRLLRGRQLGTKFRRQHPIAPYILDFYCHEHRLAIELDGGQHYTPDGLAADAARTEILKQHGITVMRFSNREVLLETEAVLEKIWRALTPTPLPEGEGLETVMLRAAMCAISGKSDAELDQLKTLPSPSGRGAGGEGEQLSAYDALAATAALFPDEMEESGLGDIPRGWGHKSLAQLTEKIGSGATPRGGKEVYLEEGVALIRSQNVYDSLFVWEGLARISDEAAVQLKGVTIQEDDVLLNITGASILRTCVVEPDALPARVNQHVAIIRAKTGVPPRFIHLHLLRPDIKSYLLGLNAGASREAITKAHIESLALLTPGPELLAAFQTATDPLFRQVQLFGQQMRVLGELRDTLLPKLLSGELPVAGLNSNLDEATQ